MYVAIKVVAQPWLHFARRFTTEIQNNFPMLLICRATQLISLAAFYQFIGCLRHIGSMGTVFLTGNHRNNVSVEYSDRIDTIVGSGGFLVLLATIIIGASQTLGIFPSYMRYHYLCVLWLNRFVTR